MTPANSHIEEKLKQILDVTASDLTAIGVVDPRTRKLRWQLVLGSISKRTEKIRQHVHAGLTGEVMRIGSFLQFHATADQVFESGEAIMLTEKLVHAAAWPLYRQHGQYYAAMLIGKRVEGAYHPGQIDVVTKLLRELEAQSLHI
ncbi:hypothetical protein ACFP56_19125 [Paenibacillus septentrionalis]|uniref:GAF domain-containing protein n=1 Tax=Paenibacillus septentrionalis TaxID=429342 RepID=A0ABW1VB95_9BACL